MKKILCLFVPLALYAQEFELKETELENYRFASLDWGDIDNDGDLDLLIAGAQFPANESISKTSIYLNDGNGNLTLDTNQNLFPIHAGDSRFIDFDNDGDLDLVETGISFGTGFNMIAIYENVDGVFNEVLLNDTGAIFGNIQIGDYQNDGDLDILFTGQGPYDDGFAYRTAIWKNNNGTFETVELTPDVPGVFNGIVNWVDVDGDDDLDIVISGNSTDGYKLRIYLYDNSSYSFDKELDTLYKYSQIACADYDNDGDMDIAVYASDDEYNRFTIIYKNEGVGFTEVYKGEGLSVNAGAEPLAFIDFDNDGDLDLALNGLTKDYRGRLYFYKNNGDDNFERVENVEPLIIGGHSVAFADVDGDLDADMLLTGFISDKDQRLDITERTKLFLNTTSVPNTAPTPPTTLTQKIENGEWKLTWEGASDEQTPEEGLTYHLSIGTATGLSDFASYKVPNNHWKISDFDPDVTYYWRIQSVDTSGIYSEVSEEKDSKDMAVVNTAVEQNQDIQLTPNPITNGKAQLKVNQPIKKISIYNPQGQLVWENIFKNNTTTQYSLSVPQLKSGNYYLECVTTDKTQKIQLLIK